MIEKSQKERLNKVLDLSWEIVFESIVSKKLIINKESSLQLHLSKLIFELGTIYCVLPGEIFTIEMETKYEKKSIDIVCDLGNSRAAIELKCFMKASNRAMDLDMYNALKDIERLESYEGFDVKRFICLTDNKYYRDTLPTGYAKTVTLKHGTVYSANKEIIPGWANLWKVKQSDPVNFKNDVICDWKTSDKWHYLYLDI